MRVRAVMHKGVASVGPNTPVQKIAKLMRAKDIGVVPVVTDGGKLVGIITDRDLVCRALGNSRRADAMAAKHVMSGKVVTCTPDDEVIAVIKRMEKKKIRRLPVLDGKNGIVGMISLGDLSNVLSRQMSGELLQSVSAHHL